MAKFFNKLTGQVEEITNPEMNPELIKGKTQVSETTPVGIITTKDLTPTTPINYVNPNQNMFRPVDVSGLTIETTPIQQQAQTDVENLMKKISQLGGEVAEKTGLEKEKDIEGLAKITSEQATIVKNLQIEAQRLANEYAGVEDVMEEKFAGRGTTRGGLAPLTAGEQRKIAIQQRSIASQALTAYAAYNTAQGNLQIAQDAIDRAIKAKYDPLREEISIEKQNLELFLGSPLATVQEKALAQFQLKKKETEEKKIDEQQGYYESIQKLYVELAGITTASPTDKIAIKKLLDKKEFTIEDVAEATRIYSQNKPQPEIKVDLLSVAEAKSLGVPYGTTRSQAAAMGITPVGIETEFAPSQYQKEWKEAGGEEGTGLTLSDWIKARTGIEKRAGREYTDEEFRIAFRNMQTKEISYEKALEEIEQDPNIRNKDRARLVASEIYKKEEIKTEEKAGGLFGSFFSRLFGK